MSSEPNDACLICLEDVETKDKEFLPCAHFFHSECIKEWLTDNPLCPICKIHVGIESGEHLKYYNSQVTRQEQEAARLSAFFQRVSRGDYDQPPENIISPSGSHGPHGPNCLCGLNQPDPQTILEMVDIINSASEAAEIKAADDAEAAEIKAADDAEAAEIRFLTLVRNIARNSELQLEPSPEEVAPNIDIVFDDLPALENAPGFFDEPNMSEDDPVSDDGLEWVD